jgi:hypothetical protein
LRPKVLCNSQFVIFTNLIIEFESLIYCEARANVIDTSVQPIPNIVWSNSLHDDTPTQQELTAAHEVHALHA